MINQKWTSQYQQCNSTLVLHHIKSNQDHTFTINSLDTIDESQLQAYFNDLLTDRDLMIAFDIIHKHIVYNSKIICYTNSHITETQMNNMDKQNTLEIAVKKIKWSLQNSVMKGMFTQGNVTYARLTKTGDPIVGVEVTEVCDMIPCTKRLEYAMVNDSIYQTMPARALCDSNG